MAVHWYPLFSHSGTETLELINCKQGFKPKQILTNQTNLGKINPGLNLSVIGENRVIVMPHKLVMRHIKTYSDVFKDDTILVTLHGYTGIIPAEIIDLPNVSVYNVHPGDIIKYPELRGRDPQAKAINLNLDSTGVVIHEVDAGIDTGTPILRKQYQIMPNTTINQLVVDLRNISVDLWIDFLTDKLCA